MAVTWVKVAFVGPICNTRSLSSGTFANESNAQIETIKITSSVGALSLTDITGESDGLIKILVAGDSYITVVHDAAKIKLVGAENLPMNAGDVLAILSTDGVWRELYRSLF